MKCWKLAAGVLWITASAFAGDHKPKVDFDRLGRASPSGPMLTRACTYGFHDLKAFFDQGSIPFDDRLVTSHKGRYCHIYFEPSVNGFRASTIGDKIAGTTNGHPLLLAPQTSVAGPSQLAGIAVVPSKLPWRSSDLLIAPDPRDPAKSMLFFDDHICHAIAKGLRDEECAFILRIELGTDESQRLVESDSGKNSPPKGIVRVR